MLSYDVLNAIESALHFDSNCLIESKPDLFQPLKMFSIMFFIQSENLAWVRGSLKQRARVRHVPSVGADPRSRLASKTTLAATPTDVCI